MPLKVISSSLKVLSNCLEVPSTMLETIAAGAMLVRVVGTMPRRVAKNFSRFRDFSSAVWEESCIFARYYSKVLRDNTLRVYD